jgi:hypothetical protein
MMLMLMPISTQGLQSFSRLGAGGASAGGGAGGSSDSDHSDDAEEAGSPESEVNPLSEYRK